eukprot:m51a1_g275 putative ribosome biogenesis protein brx1 homolog (351) ;mRNA; f:265922-267116
MLKRVEGIKARRLARATEEDPEGALEAVPSSVFESDPDDDDDDDDDAEDDDYDAAPLSDADPSSSPAATSRHASATSSRGPRAAGAATAGQQMRKNRLLVVGSRGINARGRHLMGDVMALLPQTRKESKLDAKDSIGIINELCELRSCTHAAFFDTRSRHRDLYLWLGRYPAGPTAKFYVENVHTMLEMNLMGNCLKGSRAVLSFDASFDSAPLWRLCKELLAQVFAVPKGHPRCKPFIDHVFMFSVQDGRIWFRNYQIVEQGEKVAAERSLVEVGPRFVLEPVRVFSGCFGGPVIYENLDFVAPNTALRQKKFEEAVEAGRRGMDYLASKERRAKSSVPLVNTVDAAFQ